MTPDEAIAAVEAGDDALLIEEPETEQLDFKQAPYKLDNDKGKWELAKDVAALANSGGGCLIIGVATETPEDREDEIAVEIKPFPQELVDVTQMRATLDAASGVYPIVKGVDIRRFPRPDGKAMAAVHVPPQDDDDQPFMVVRMVEGDQKRGVGIGIPVRSGPHTYWQPPGAIHRDLSDGRRSRRVTGAAAIPPAEAVFGVTSSELAKRGDQQLDMIEQYMGWSDGATLMLGAIPTMVQEIPIPHFYEQSGIAGCVGSPPEIRHAGFSIAWPNTPENLDGALINASTERRILWVDPDGAAFAGAAGLETFLTRGGGKGYATEPGPRVINPTVLVEWAYLYFKFVEECIVGSVEGPMRWVVRLRGAKLRPWSLRMVAGPHMHIFAAEHEAGLDDMSAVGELTGDPGQDAFAALERIYTVFGFNGSDIPYTSGGKVDPEQIIVLSPH